MKSFERRTQVAKAMQRELASIIQSGGLKDDRINAFVSIINVELNPSLSSATVTYSLLVGDLEEQDLQMASTQAALQEHASYMRGVVGRRLNLRYAPKLFFTPGNSLRQTVDLIHLIDQTVQTDKATHEEI